MEITIDKAIERFKSNAEYERTHDNLQGCLEFRQLAEWLWNYQEIIRIVDDYKCDRISGMHEIEKLLGVNR